MWSATGLARDGSTLYVTCAGGEIVKLPAAGGPATVFARVDKDLRDVVIQGGDLLVSRLRRAEVLRIAKANGAELSRGRPQFGSAEDGGPESEPFEPFVGYRLVATANGGLLVHQLGTNDVVNVGVPSAYGTPFPCGGPVMTVVSTFDTTGGNSSIAARMGGLIGSAVVPVDLAVSPDGASVSIIAAGNGHTRELPQVHVLRTEAATSAFGCNLQQPPFPFSDAGSGHASADAGALSNDPPGQAVAVTFTPDGATLAAFTREPAALHLRAVDAPWGAPWTTIDGRVWKFSTGERRTQSLQGTLEGTAPYHWGGDVPAIETFATDTFVTRMAGAPLAADQIQALKGSVEMAAALRGKALFEDQTIGCSGCHSGVKLTKHERQRRDGWELPSPLPSRRGNARPVLPRRPGTDARRPIQRLQRRHEPWQDH
jgi:hypothetical protein